MPRSRIRRRYAFTPPKRDTNAVRVGSPRWLVPLMIGCFVVGLLWVVVYYVTQAAYPVADWGLGNMGVGFGLIILGFGLATRWK